MTKQSDALMLADYFSMFKTSSHLLADGTPLHIAAETELRRLHALCEEQNNLLEKARDALCQYTSPGIFGGRVPIDEKLVRDITNHLHQHEGKKHDHQTTLN